MTNPLARLWPETAPEAGITAAETLEDLIEDPRRVQVGPKPVILNVPTERPDIAL